MEREEGSKKEEDARDLKWRKSNPDSKLIYSRRKRKVCNTRQKLKSSETKLWNILFKKSIMKASTNNWKKTYCLSFSLPSSNTRGKMVTKETLNRRFRCKITCVYLWISLSLLSSPSQSHLLGIFNIRLKNMRFHAKRLCISFHSIALHSVISTSLRQFIKGLSFVKSFLFTHDSHLLLCHTNQMSRTNMNTSTKWFKAVEKKPSTKSA